MEMITKLELRGFTSPRHKGTYRGLGLGEKLITFPLSDDMQEDLKNNFNLLLQRDPNKGRFPLESEISLNIKVYTDKAISLNGVVKNTLDGCTGVIYRDDRKVDSLVIVKAAPKHHTDELEISVLCGTTLRGFTPQSVESFLVASLIVDTVVEDRYLPYPPSARYVNSVDSNADYDKRLKEELRRSYPAPPIDGNLALSLVMESPDCLSSDIDNLALNLMVNMEGILYGSTTQINKLHLLKRKGRENKSTITLFR